MKIRTRLTILFTFITATILLLFASVIYYSAKKNREKDFYTSLKKEAITKANLFLNAEVEVKTLQEIYHNNRKILNEVEVAIYDTSFHLLYHDAVDLDFVKETRPMIDEIYKKGEVRFYQKDWQVIGLKFPYKNKKYLITAAAYDQYGYDKLNSLLRTSSFVFVISILFIYLAGHFFSKKAFEPVTQMTDKVKKISATNLDLRLNTNKNNDELTDLANTFNEMLNRLENSFDAQKHFVSNISHELRTPLTAMFAELQLTAEKERSNEQYKKAIEHIISDTQKLIHLSNNLLDLAKANYDSAEIAFKNLRLDEVLIEARNDVLHNNSSFKINIIFEKDFEDDADISVNGNEYLLKVAFANLMENSCKYSNDKQSTVAVSFDKEGIILRFSDNGIGIAADDLKSIFVPFYRGENKTFTEGNGIGLSLSQKIVLLHHGNISVTSQTNIGTIFTIQLPHL
ncbi:Signal transduction histidine kinase [Pseudarcicella hirudinis]|uniref:histidine kinase n=1 Tax=Pseudarcicella hirudinis TaxID=1079859 RepID=A0A1I5YN54_9BACT|nr:HAMP domain-containing sensor histidine kinase [Pseudarcicella hirudinis]SFQ45678.1 Signal transduction histidine kinase [Pseudarcicella hirudinis]